jgi:hypothetical protein
MALTANCNRDPRKHPRPYEAADFMPSALAPKRDDRRIPAPITALKALL